MGIWNFLLVNSYLYHIWIWYWCLLCLFRLFPCLLAFLMTFSWKPHAILGNRNFVYLENIWALFNACCSCGYHTIISYSCSKFFFFFCIHYQLWVSQSILSQKVSILKFSAIILCWCIEFLLVWWSPPGKDLYQIFTMRTWWGFLTLTKLWRFPFVTHWSLSLLP